MKSCQSVHLGCSPSVLSPLYCSLLSLASLLFLSPAFPHAALMGLPYRALNSRQFVLSLPSGVGKGLMPVLGCNFRSPAWPDSACQSHEQRPWSQEFLPSPLNYNQGGGGGTNSKGVPETFCCLQGLEKTEKARWRGTLVFKPLLSCCKVGTRVWSELRFGLLRRGQSLRIYHAAVELSRKDPQ